MKKFVLTVTVVFALIMTAFAAKINENNVNVSIVETDHPIELMGGMNLYNIEQINIDEKIDNFVEQFNGSYKYDILRKQEAIDSMMTTASIAGLDENSMIVQKLNERWNQYQREFEYDRDILATVIYNESWGDCSDRHRDLVAAVVYNRLLDDRFPSTVEEIVTAPMQYLPEYTDPYSYYGLRARENEDNWHVCQEIAERALRGEIDCDTAVVYQAEFMQGYGVYEVHYTSYSTTYFCYG